MNSRSFATPVIQDREAMEEFADVLSDRAPEVERDVARLKNLGADREVTADLFRAIHNIKGDAALCKFQIGVLLAHPIESLMSRFRDGEFPFSDLLAELILLSIDRLELATDATLGGKSLEPLQLEQLLQGLEEISQAPAERIDPLAADLIEAVTGFRPISGNTTAPAPRPLPQQTSAPEGPDEDLEFFRSLALQFESRSPLFKGRTARILRLAQETNRIAGSPVDAQQLEAAVYMHDVGMMLLPESVWLKVGRMSDEEKQILRNHPGFAAGLLQRIPGWDAAASMVAQHHEMYDGGGYPLALKHEEITPGAKILSIVDAFEAVMLKHIHRGKNRSVLRAIAEINAGNKQFAPEWIGPFNAVIRKTLENA
ncbi:HD domain-containing phosphohydrolase [Dechloromonas sp. ZY10]|uniref:HD domain-containing phosphohydrolase n=1 Tax=Dechloromonas aquae TaxID=2664436 RepID=UPI00352722E4